MTNDADNLEHLEEMQALRRDAERYRFLRDEDVGYEPFHGMLYVVQYVNPSTDIPYAKPVGAGVDLDTAIDHARGVKEWLDNPK